MFWRSIYGSFGESNTFFAHDSCFWKELFNFASWPPIDLRRGVHLKHQNLVLRCWKFWRGLPIWPYPYYGYQIDTRHLIITVCWRTSRKILWNYQQTACKNVPLVVLAHHKGSTWIGDRTEPLNWPSAIDRLPPLNPHCIRPQEAHAQEICRRSYNPQQN